MTAASALTEAIARARRKRRSLTTEVGCPHMSLQGCAAMDGIIAALTALQSVHADLTDTLEGIEDASDALEDIVDQLSDLASDTYAHWLKRMTEAPYVPGDDAWKYEGDDA